MVMAYIWTGMVLTAVLFSFWSGAGGVLSQAVLEGAQAGVTLTLSMAGAVCLWSGVGRVMECAGLNRILARLPPISQLPKGPQGRGAGLCQCLCQPTGIGKCGHSHGGSRYPAYGPVCKARRGQS